MQCNKSKVLFLAIFICFTVNIYAVSVPKAEVNDHGDQINNNTNSDTLIFANVIYRHGDRTIDHVYANDPYKNESEWPEGFGALTNEGKRRQFRLGQYFRKRYSKLIGAKYSRNEVYVRSTDVDRALMSAQANLAGLYFPSEEERWNASILWQPIPVHTAPREFDHILNGLTNCPKFIAARETYFKENPEVQRIYSEHADLFRHWTESCGTNISNTHDALYLFKTLRIEKRQNKTLADWAEKAIEPNGVMEYIAAFHYRSFADTRQLARLKTGYLLKEIFNRFAMKINSTLKPDRSLWLYSGHDDTIITVLNSLEVFKMHMPAYASSIHIELFKNDEGKHYVKFFYRNFEEDDLAPIEIPNCGDKCSLERLYELYNEVIPGDYHSECY